MLRSKLPWDLLATTAYNGNQIAYIFSDQSLEEGLYISSDKSSEEDEEELSEYNNIGHKSNNNGNSGVQSESSSTVPDEILFGVESYDSDRINHGNSMQNIELCDWDDSSCECDEEDRYNEYKCKYHRTYISKSDYRRLYERTSWQHPTMWQKLLQQLFTFRKLSRRVWPKRIKSFKQSSNEQQRRQICLLSWEYILLPIKRRFIHLT